MYVMYINRCIFSSGYRRGSQTLHGLKSTCQAVTCLRRPRGKELRVAHDDGQQGKGDRGTAFCQPKERV